METTQVPAVTTAFEGQRFVPTPPACWHRGHRVPHLPRPVAQLILPECAGHAAWLEARRGGVGGSEIGGIVGVSEYETTFSVWRNKIQGGRDLSGEPAVEWGHRLEESVALKTADEIGLVARPGGGLWAVPGREHLRVTPDRFACARRSWRALGVIECKTAGDDDGWASGSINPSGDNTGAAPMSYQAQLQWQLGILGLERGWLGCLILNNARDFYVVEIAFDRAWFEELAAAADRFWHDHVLTEEPPMHDHRHPRTEQLLKELYPHVVKPSVELPEDAREWLDDYRAAKKRADEAVRDLDAIRNYFRLQVGDAAAGYLGEDKVVSYPDVTTRSVSVQLLREKYPQVADECTVTSTHRRLTIRAR